MAASQGGDNRLMMSLEILTNTQTDEFSRSEKNEGEKWL